jgi:hypothetical protein
MKRHFDHERLLADALNDGAPPGFRETLLANTIGHAQSRCRWRRVRRGMVVMAVLVMGAVLLRFNPPPRPVGPVVSVPSKAPDIAGCTIVHTEAIPTGWIVRTVATTQAPTQFSFAKIRVVETRSAPDGCRMIEDDELLALMGGRPVALVSCGPRCKQLIFVNPGDEQGFIIN